MHDDLICTGVKGCRGEEVWLAHLLLSSRLHVETAHRVHLQ
jgi:hypothetical protein